MMSINTEILDMHYWLLFIPQDPLQNPEMECHRRGLCRTVLYPEN
jgi:hypothetical protein